MNLRGIIFLENDAFGFLFLLRFLSENYTPPFKNHRFILVMQTALPLIFKMPYEKTPFKAVKKKSVNKRREASFTAMSAESVQSAYIRRTLSDE